jgi:hypothetical protein
MKSAFTGSDVASTISQDVREHLVARDSAISIAAREREACRSGGECFESEPFQINRSSDIPRVWKHEASGLVHRAELCRERCLRECHLLALQAIFQCHSERSEESRINFGATANRMTRDVSLRST